MLMLFASLLTALAPSPAHALQDSATSAADGSVAPAFNATPALDAGRRQLLEVAFEAASAMPLMPHAKNRARAQLGVIEACLELDQPELAQEWTGRIENWQRGEAYGDVARWLVAHGRNEEAQRCLALAGGVLDGPSGGEDWQGWQRDRIRARIASTHMALGHDEQAGRFAADLADSELRPVAEERARQATEEEADAFLRDVVAVFQSGSFEQVRAALDTCVGLHARFHADEARRELIARTLREGWGRMPIPVRLEVLEEMADSALERGDPVGAQALLDEARPLVTGGNILPETRVPLRARLAVLRFRAGDAAAARAEADEALEQFEAEREQILGTEQADVLRHLAEAYHALGDRHGSLAIFRRVIELGVANPNSRPRAEDLAATCCSLARIGLQPTEDMQARLLAIRDALGPPW